MTAKTLRAADPRAEQFRKFRDDAGLRTYFQSAQSERLAL